MTKRVRMRAAALTALLALSLIATAGGSLLASAASGGGADGIYAGAKPQGVTWEGAPVARAKPQGVTWEGAGVTWE